MSLLRVFFSGLLLSLLLSGCSQTPPAPSVSIGSQVNFSQLRDQFGHPFNHLEAMTTVLYVDTMKAKDLVRAALAQLDLSCMKTGQLVYLADISGMPALISTLIAVPRMRQYPYPIWLDYDGLATAGLPVKDDVVTVLHVKNGTIGAVEFVPDTQGLVSRLKPLCGPAKLRSSP